MAIDSAMKTEQEFGSLYTNSARSPLFVTIWCDIGHTFSTTLTKNGFSKNPNNGLNAFRSRNRSMKSANSNSSFHISQFYIFIGC